MNRTLLRKTGLVLGGFFALFLALRYLLPLVLPFVLGALMALAAEPAVRLLHRRLPRGLAAGIGVTLTYLILGLLLTGLGGILLRELASLSAALPQARQMLGSGLQTLRDGLLSLAGNAPEGLAGMLTQGVQELFSGSTALLSRATDLLLKLATGLLTRLPDGALGVGTGIIASYMISVKLPGIRSYLHTRTPPRWREQILPALRTARDTVGAYLKAQAKLLAVTFCAVTGGLLLLRVRFAPVWGFLIALVDAVPLLGTGTVMLPWALVCLLQSDPVRAAGLMGIYVTALTLRSVLEPRLVGKQMGIDPLLALLALYVGYRLWGVMGMLLAPMAAATVLRLANASLRPAEAE